MNQKYEMYLEKFEQLKELYQKYNFSEVVKELNRDIEDITDFKVTVPLVGAFSTGKSTLLNELMGVELLSTSITPETSIPAELTLGTDNVIYCMKDGTVRNADVSTSGVQKIPEGCELMKISMDNKFFEQIPDLRIVDMPGFDSGIERHNQAINDYLPKSLAYIIAVAADESTIRASVLNFLIELQLNNMPVYAVVTKADKCDDDDVSEIVSNIRSIIEKKMHINDLKIAVTGMNENGTEQMLMMLKEIQAQSENIFVSHYGKKLNRYVSSLRSYLNKQISAPDTNIIQVKEDKKLLEEKIADMKKGLEMEKRHFSDQAENCIDAIRSKVESELRSSSSVMENILLQGGSIQEKVNFLVRNAITAGIREQLEPKLQRYVDNVSDMIHLGDIMADRGELLDKSIVDENKARKEAIHSAAAQVTPVITTALGSIFGPIGIVIGAAGGLLLSSFINSKSREYEEYQKREAASQRVQQVIDEVMASVRTQIEAAVHGMTANVEIEIEKAVAIEIELKQKELADLETSLSTTEQEKEIKIIGYKVDLELIENMIR